MFINRGMPDWGPSVAEELRRDVRFALTFEIGKSRQPLTDVERDLVARAIVDHIRLCNWKVERGPPWAGFAYPSSSQTVRRLSVRVYLRERTNRHRHPTRRLDVDQSI